MITIVSKDELITLINAINSCFERSNSKDYIETKEIAYEYCLRMDIREDKKGRQMLNKDFWVLFFGWRSLHNRLTIMLDALEKLQLIKCLLYVH